MEPIAGARNVDNQWLLITVKAEEQRLRRTGATPLLLTTKNFTMITELGTPSRIVNKVELDTGFDFDKINQILVSDPLPYPHDPEWLYVHVLLITTPTSAAKPNTTQFPLIMPYLYKPVITIADASLTHITPPEPSAATKRKNLKAASARPTILRNELRDWLLVNNHGKTSRHVVHEFINQ
ncbi:hypothetical protein SeLEV6574_g05303 [Synchytrium endobioticum]|uniref:Uncharacterized protein n=1 Tax=Synchytrium endobioticum TaxID=286115 RepID=A0A507CUW0_9FUNG|nr:hypothetical protein SeLEV6574_g05303 [Synchytrium endobioticum]